MPGLAGKICLSYGYIAGIKHPNRKQHAGGRRSVYSSLIFQLTVITEGSQSKNPKQELGLRNWCRGLGRVLLTGLVFMACSVCFLTLPRTIHPWVAPLWGGPTTSIINQENMSQVCLWASLLGEFSQLRFPCWKWL